MHGSLYSTIVEHEGGNKKLMANGCFQQVLRGSLGMVDGKVSKRQSLRGEKGEENILNGWRDLFVQLDQMATRNRSRFAVTSCCPLSSHMKGGEKRLERNITCSRLAEAQEWSATSSLDETIQPVTGSDTLAECKVC